MAFSLSISAIPRRLGSPAPWRCRASPMAWPSTGRGPTSAAVTRDFTRSIFRTRPGRASWGLSVRARETPPARAPPPQAGRRFQNAGRAVRSPDRGRPRHRPRFLLPLHPEIERVSADRAADALTGNSNSGGQVRQNLYISVDSAQEVHPMFIKRILRPVLILTLAAFIFSVAGFGQTRKHDVSLSYGFISIDQLTDILGHVPTLLTH